MITEELLCCNPYHNVIYIYIERERGKRERERDKEREVGGGSEEKDTEFFVAYKTMLFH